VFSITSRAAAIFVAFGLAAACAAPHARLAPASVRDALFRCAQREAHAAGFNVTLVATGPDSLIMMRKGPEVGTETSVESVLFTVVQPDSTARPELRTEVSTTVVWRTIGVQHLEPSIAFRAAADSVRARCQR